MIYVFLNRLSRFCTLTRATQEIRATTMWAMDNFSRPGRVSGLVGILCNMLSSAASVCKRQSDVSVYQPRIFRFQNTNSFMRFRSLRAAPLFWCCQDAATAKSGGVLAAWVSRPLAQEYQDSRIYVAVTPPAHCQCHHCCVQRCRLPGCASVSLAVAFFTLADSSRQDSSLYMEWSCRRIPT